MTVGALGLLWVSVPLSLVTLASALMLAVFANVIAQGAALEHVRLALGRGDLEAARAAIARVPRLRFPEVARVVAVCEADVRFFSGEPQIETAANDDPVRATLERALGHANRGERGELSELLRRHGALLIDGAVPHQRALVFCLRRVAGLWAPSVGSARAPRELGRLAAGASAMAPEAAEYVRDDYFLDPEPRVVEAEPPPASSPPRKELATKRPPARPLATLALFCFLLALLAFGVDAVTFALGTLIIYVGGVALLAFRRQRRALALVARAHELEWSGDLAAARAALSEVVGGSSDTEIHAAAARLAARDARFDDALRACDAGLRDPSSSTAPSLLFTRALCLAALGRAEALDAAAELRRLHPDSLFAGNVASCIELLGAIRSGDVRRVNEVSSRRRVHHRLPMFVELAADVVRARAGAGVGPDFVARVEAELEHSPQLRRWIEAVVPPASAELLREGPFRVAPVEASEVGMDAEEVAEEEAAEDARRRSGA